MSSAGMSSLHTRAAPVGRRALSVFLVLHGLAHLVGAQGSWEATSTGTPPEYLWGFWTISAAPLLWLLAVAWAATAVAYAHASWLLWELRQGWLKAVTTATTVSMVLSIFAMPMAVAGVVINAILLAGVLVLWQRRHHSG